MTDYRSLTEQAVSLVRDVPHLTANLANLSALLWGAVPDLNWAGFYLLEGETLVLGPFQGKPACIEIPLGRGVCGTAAAEDRTVPVPDVHAFPGHIACDGDSRSELVVPLHSGGGVIGVLDLDSPVEGRFTEEDVRGLESLARAVERELFSDDSALADTMTIQTTAVFWSEMFRCHEHIPNYFFEDSPYLGDSLSKLGFIMDCGHSFNEIYPDIYLVAYDKITKLFPELNIQILGNLIFSEWRYWNHWSMTRMNAEAYEWFALAFSRLAELALEEGHK